MKLNTPRVFWLRFFSPWETNSLVEFWCGDFWVHNQHVDYNLEFITRIGDPLSYYSLKKRKEPGRQREESQRHLCSSCSVRHLTNDQFKTHYPRKQHRQDFLMGRVRGGVSLQDRAEERSEGRHGGSSSQPALTLPCPTPLCMGHVTAQLKTLHSMGGLMGVSSIEISVVSFPRKWLWNSAHCILLPRWVTPEPQDHRNILSPPSHQSFPTPIGTTSRNFPLYGTSCKYEHVGHKWLWG